MQKKRRVMMTKILREIASDISIQYSQKKEQKKKKL